MAPLHNSVCTVRTLTSTAIIICLACCFTGALAQEFMFISHRSPMDNFITLSCRDHLSVPIIDALFFLNGSRIDTRPEFQRTQDRTGLTVIMTRDLEGIYSCGNSTTQSNNMSFIAYPDSSFIDHPQPLYVITGERVQLDCLVTPGALLQHYFVSWDVSENVIARTTSHSPTPEFIDDDRYDLNRSSLSLIIDSVQLSDASDAYHCVMSVADPFTHVEYTYHLLRTIDISLVVYAPPSIDTRSSTLRNTISVEGQSLSFNCIARGHPPPVIIWQVNDAELTAHDPNIRITSTINQDEYYNITTSQLEVMSITVEMSGNFKCIARSNLNERALPQDERVAQVIVYVAPSIVTRSSILQNTTSVKDQSVSFNCTARGHPPPEIIWQLNNVPVTPSNPNIRISTTLWQDGYYNVSSSHLRFLSVKSFNSGKLKCIARSSVSNNVPELPNDEKEVYFDVLGAFDLRVDVTQKKDIFFEVSLPKALVSPIRLVINYTDLVNPSQSRRQMSKTMFQNESEILYREVASNVPYVSFRVSVRLTSAGLFGPPVTSSTEYSQNQPTIFDDCLLRGLDIIVIAASPSGAIAFVVLVIGCVIVVPCLFLKHKRKIKMMNMQEMVAKKPLEVIDFYKCLLANESNSDEYRTQILEKLQELNLKLIKETRAAKRAALVASREVSDAAQDHVRGDGPKDIARGPPPPPYEASQSQATESKNYIEARAKFTHKIYEELCKDCDYDVNGDHVGNDSTTNLNSNDVAGSQTEAIKMTPF